MDTRHLSLMCQDNRVPIELILAVATFGFVTSVTPGPNNTILFATGVNYGVKKALPFLFGIMLGLTVILSAIGLGLGVVFVTLPGLYQILKYLGFAYILFLGYSIIRSGYKPIDENSKLFGLFEAAFFPICKSKGLGCHAKLHGLVYPNWLICRGNNWPGCRLSRTHLSRSASVGGVWGSSEEFHDRSQKAPNFQLGGWAVASGQHGPSFVYGLAPA